MTTKRILAFLLAALITAASFSSCASGDESNDTASDGTSVTSEEVQTEENADEIDFSSMSFVERVRYANSEVSDGLPEKSYDGREVLIHTIAADGTYPTELTGDTVNDAQYQQTMNVEERFDVKLKYCGNEFEGWDGYVSGIRSLFLAGDSFCDLMINWNTSTADFVCQGFFEDLTQYSVIDTTKPWFFGDEMSLYSYEGHTFTATGMMDVPSMTGRVECFFFNKDIATNYNVEDLYNVVREGRWTLDYVKSLIADFYYDIDGDGTKNDADVYGMSYAAAGSWMCTLASLGIPQIDKDENGNPCLTVFSNADRAQTIMDSMKDMLSTSGARSISDWGYEAFLSGNALLCASSLSTLTSLRDGDFDYGVLPRYKADETQDNYYASYLPDPWAIPATATDKEMSAVILTAIAAEGYREVLPSYYETAIKSKYSSDEESGEMLDLMFQNVRSDGMFMYGNSSYIYNLWNYFKATQGFASYWESQKKSLETTMNSAIEKMQTIVGDTASE